MWDVVLVYILNVYDSMNWSVNLQTKMQTCSFWKSPIQQITFQMVNIQRQPNVSDCGVFAVAVATELVHGKDPVLSFWDVSRMRGHLAKCIEDKKIDCFPQARTRCMPLGNWLKKVVRETLFCVCRMPNDRGLPMIQCDNCKLWFHKSCDPKESLMGKTWVCKTHVVFNNVIMSP